jgi:hypothetical protein
MRGKGYFLNIPRCATFRRSIRGTPIPRNARFQLVNSQIERQRRVNSRVAARMPQWRFGRAYRVAYALSLGLIILTALSATLGGTSLQATGTNNIFLARQTESESVVMSVLPAETNQPTSPAKKTENAAICNGAESPESSTSSAHEVNSASSSNSPQSIEAASSPATTQYAPKPFVLSSASILSSILSPSCLQCSRISELNKLFEYSSQGDIQSAVAYDLRCTGNSFSGSFYHKLKDCLGTAVGFFGAALSGKGGGLNATCVGVVLENGPATELYSDLVTAVSSSGLPSDRPCPLVEEIPSTSKVTARFNATFQQWWSLIMWGIVDLRPCGECLRGAVSALYLPQGASLSSKSPPPCSLVILLGRRGESRRFLDEPALSAALDAEARALGLQFIVYTGSGTTRLGDVVRTFAAACLVVGYHGAGLAHTVFMRPGATLLEIAAYNRPLPAPRFPSNPSVVPWQPGGTCVRGSELVFRSNCLPLVAFAPQRVSWPLYFVDHDTLRPPLPAGFNLTTSKQIKDWEKLIADRNILLGERHIRAISSFIRATLGEDGAKFSSNGGQKVAVENVKGTGSLRTRKITKPSKHRK